LWAFSCNAARLVVSGSPKCDAGLQIGTWKFIDPQQGRREHGLPVGDSLYRVVRDSLLVNHISRR
jgi:hypothetical protein